MRTMSTLNPLGQTTALAIGNGRTATLAPPLWTAGYRSLVGRRDSNQDTYLFCPIVEGESALLLVADGMGGYTGGERASQIARDQMLTLAQAAKSNPTPEYLRSQFPLGYEAIKKQIEEAAAVNTELSNMGTTLACVAVFGNRYVVANIGDSRVYHYNGSSITQVTLDHNAATDAQRRGSSVPMNTPQDAKMARALTRALRPNAPSMPELFPSEGQVAYTANPGDVVLVMSDGMHGSVPPEQMTYVLQNAASLADALQQLETLAFNNGSKDNITIVAVAFGGWKTGTLTAIPSKAAPLSAALPAPAHSSRQKILAISALIITLCLICLAFVFMNHNTSSNNVPANRPNTGGNATTNGNTGSSGTSNSTGKGTEPPVTPGNVVTPGANVGVENAQTEPKQTTVVHPVHRDPPAVVHHPVIPPKKSKKPVTPSFKSGSTTPTTPGKASTNNPND